jgi:hypothetical protein
MEKKKMMKGSNFISSHLGNIKPEIPESVKVMMNTSMEDNPTKKTKLIVKKKKK